MRWQEGEQGTAEEGEVGEGVGVAGAGAVFAPEGVAAPMVADLDAGPVALDEGEPLRGAGLASKKWTSIQAAMMSFLVGWFSKATGER